MSANPVESLAELLLEHGPALVLTGAGCSTESGIPDYRDRNGDWKHRRPVMFDDFVRHESVRRRYWAGSLIGWRRIEAARPNRSHLNLARLEDGGHVHTLVTQNVDGLHRRAGSRNIIDLHGNLETVCCLQCGARLPRRQVQQWLLDSNPDHARAPAQIAPDGDATPGARDLAAFNVPACRDCGGILKPDVVFFGESIPAQRASAGMAALSRAGCLLVVGSSLMVFSGYRYCREAAGRGIPILAVNRGRTRADDLFTLKLEAECGGVLERLAGLLQAPRHQQQFLEFE